MLFHKRLGSKEKFAKQISVIIRLIQRRSGRDNPVFSAQLVPQEKRFSGPYDKSFINYVFFRLYIT